MHCYPPPLAQGKASLGASEYNLNSAVWEPSRASDIDDKMPHWIAKKNRAPEMLEDEEYRRLWTDVTKGAYLPPDHTKHKKNVSQMAHDGLKKVVKDNKRRRTEGMTRLTDDALTDDALLLPVTISIYYMFSLLYVLLSVYIRCSA